MFSSGMAQLCEIAEVICLDDVGEQVDRGPEEGVADYDMTHRHAQQQVQEIDTVESVQEIPGKFGHFRALSFALI